MDMEQYWTDENQFFSAFQNVSLPHGGISLDDLNELYALIFKNAYKTNHNRMNIQICELGCWTGMSTVLFGKIAQESGSGGRVKAVDWFQGAETDNLETAAKMFRIKDICAGNLKTNRVDSVVELVDAKTDDAVKTVPDNFFDVVFIDADHRYESVKRDMLNWYPKVKRGGLICGHDCDILLKDLKTLYDTWGHLNYKGFHLGVAKAVPEIFPDAQKTQTGVVWFKVKT